MKPLSPSGRGPVDPGLYEEVARFGARDMDICMQCGNCSASCPLSTGNDSFPRRIYRYLQLGLRDRLRSSPVPWLCYYCGECNTDCPRGAEPAETMMAVRRWLTTQYDWTGLARRLYLSEAWEIGALSAVSLVVVLLFVFFHGPVITDRVAVNTFAPVLWIEIGDLVMAAVLSGFLLSNAFRMARWIMADVRVPLRLYLTEAWVFVLHFATQKRWRSCGTDRSRWFKHFILVTGYMTMMSLIIVFIRWFQVDDDSWHFSSLFGYYATAALLFLTVEMGMSRRRKKETIHRYSEPTDWLFLLLLFLTTLTGILMHIVRLAGWPMATYVMYVIHLAIAVPMLVVEVPFGKWSHMFYRPLAVFLSRVREKALIPSQVDAETVRDRVGDLFQACLQCGTCTSVCPLNQRSVFSPRRIMRRIAHGTGTEQGVDAAVWDCLTCNSCGVQCPRGIDIIDVLETVRGINVREGRIPAHAAAPLSSLERHRNPWNRPGECRWDWTQGLRVPSFSAGMDHCVVNCCTAAFAENPDDPGRRGAKALTRLMTAAKLSWGTLGRDETCCGDPARTLGNDVVFARFRDVNTRLFLSRGVRRLITVSPHCFHTFTRFYPELADRVVVEHYICLLDRLLAENRLVPRQETDRVVTYHDPCYLGRHNGIYDEPRRILTRIPGVKLVEMAAHRENSLCCGGGGGNAWRSEIAATDGLGARRVREALACGAEIIATACPFCARMLQSAVAALGVADRLAVRDVADLLFASTGLDIETQAGGAIPLKKEREASHV